MKLKIIALGGLKCYFFIKSKSNFNYGIEDSGRFK